VTGLRCMAPASALSAADLGVRRNWRAGRSALPPARRAAPDAAARSASFRGESPCC
jgi:hypothetical protein